MLRPLEGEAAAQRRLGVGVMAPQGSPRMLRPLEGEAAAQRRLGWTSWLVFVFIPNLVLEFLRQQELRADHDHRLTRLEPLRIEPAAVECL